MKLQAAMRATKEAAQPDPHFILPHKWGRIRWGLARPRSDWPLSLCGLISNRSNLVISGTSPTLAPCLLSRQRRTYRRPHRVADPNSFAIGRNADNECRPQSETKRSKYRLEVKNCALQQKLCAEYYMSPGNINRTTQVAHSFQSPRRCTPSRRQRIINGEMHF